jgi:hypothetical protein
MNVSLRSQMTAGVAALGAAVVAVAPITQPDLLPSVQRVAASVELSAFSNPVIAISDTVFFAIGAILDQDFLADDIVWPDTFYGIDGVYAPVNFGLLPNLVNQFSLGTLSGLVNNLSGYAFAGAYSALSLVDGVAGSAFNAPFAVVDAVQELIAGDPAAALQTLVTGIVEPLQFAVEDALFGVGYIVDNIIENIQIVTTSTLPFVVSGLVGAVVDNLTYIATSLADTATSFVANLAALDIEGAWNDVVDGVLGPFGTLGQISDLTIGVGLGEEIEGEFVLTNPSIRSVLTSELQRLGSQKFNEDGGITNDPLFISEAAAAAAVTEPAPVAAVQVSAPAVALESAPAPVEAPAAQEAVVEAPAPVGEPAVTTEVAEVAPAVQAEAPAPVSEPDVTSAVVSEADAAPSSAAAPSEAQAGDGDTAAAKTPKRGHRGAKSTRGAN